MQEACQNKNVKSNNYLRPPFGPRYAKLSNFPTLPSPTRPRAGTGGITSCSATPAAGSSVCEPIGKRVGKDAISDKIALDHFRLPSKLAAPGIAS